MRRLPRTFFVLCSLLLTAQTRSAPVPSPVAPVASDSSATPPAPDHAGLSAPPELAIAYGNLGVRLGDESIFKGIVGAAAWDSSQELVWFTSKSTLYVIDLRDSQRQAVPIAEKMPEGSFGISGVSTADSGSAYAGIYPIIVISAKPRVDHGSGAYGEIWEEQDKAARKLISKIKITGAQWLTAQIGRKPRAGEAAVPSTFTAVGRVSLPKGAGDCEDPKSCGQAALFGSTVYRLIVTSQSCGDACHTGCTLYDPASKMYTNPGAGGAWGASPNQSATCTDYLFSQSGNSYLVGKAICQIGATINCAQADEWNYVGWYRGAGVPTGGPDVANAPSERVAEPLPRVPLKGGVSKNYTMLLSRDVTESRVSMSLMRALATRFHAVCMAVSKGDFILAHRVLDRHHNRVDSPVAFVSRLSRDVHGGLNSCRALNEYWDAAPDTVDLSKHVSEEGGEQHLEISPWASAYGEDVEFVYEDGAWRLFNVDDFFFVIPRSLFNRLQGKLPALNGAESARVTVIDDAEVTPLLSAKQAEKVQKFLEKQNDSLPKPQHEYLEVFEHPPASVTRNFDGLYFPSGSPDVAIAVAQAAMKPTAQEAINYCAQLKVGDVTGFQIAQANPYTRRDVAVWRLNKAGDAYLAYACWEWHASTGNRWTGFGTQAGCKNVSGGEAKPEDASIPSDRRQVFCGVPFPYADELKRLAESKASGAIKAREAAIRKVGFK